MDIHNLYRSPDIRSEITFYGGASLMRRRKTKFPTVYECDDIPPQHSYPLNMRCLILACAVAFYTIEHYLHLVIANYTKNEFIRYS